ncbi:hypothetical protein XELAEV_18012711mg [Xenopus laevis]|uniref:Uncharacterized protein n=1 Tax=Xenopus laevis TaxID=8355 RepID=A0A974HYD8_XENLA|nr:hypothetical protein XELAEV_18012711mg [Xenopus laevis]
MPYMYLFRVRPALVITLKIRFECYKCSDTQGNFVHEEAATFPSDSVYPIPHPKATKYQWCLSEQKYVFLKGILSSENMFFSKHIS